MLKKKKKLKLISAKDKHWNNSNKYYTISFK